jgi:FixJ family two-component response regulator
VELAEAQIGISERSKKAAFVGFLPKPFDLQVLVETVGRVVNDPMPDRVRLPRSAAESIGAWPRHTVRVATAPSTEHWK